ncbi:synaptonemal complex protein 2-like isoform X2 [Hippocampus comes]|uniref:synaptonemal complex protein 2-like isoform X2 n=1 Tax=Hippocampus comes TaxID=109280 RepID=UPI00094EBE8B|nr:PREDICTED: uncharacterized protein LOC109526309 isoform X2 [Hippocampus comes]
MMEMEMEACLSRGDSSRLARVLRDEGVSGSTLAQLGQLVRKQLSLADFGRVDVVLKSLEILAEDRDLNETLVGLGIAHQVVSWFQTLRQLLTSRAPRSSAQLRPIESFYDFLLVLSRSHLPALELSLTLLELLLTLLESQLHFGVRLEAVRTFNSILDCLSRDQRRRVQSERMLLQTMPEVAATIQTVGDYELQVSLSEALCRLTPRKERAQQASRWFSCSDVADAFSRIKDTDFEVDCRRFLNFLNNRQGDVRRVWTFPCIRAFLETTELFRPSDDKLDEFWVDFNFGSRCISFFIDLPQGFLWGSVHLLKEEVERFQLEVQPDAFSFPEGGAARAVLGVHLSVPITHLSRKGRRVRLLFRPELLGELEAAAARVFGGDDDAASLPSQEPEKDSAGGVRASPSAARPLGRTYRKKPRAQLKGKSFQNQPPLRWPPIGIPPSAFCAVLPLSSPSGDDEASLPKTCRSTAAMAFDQVVHSTPSKASELRFPAVGAGPRLRVLQEENVDISPMEASRLNQKRAAPYSGDLSDEYDAMEKPVGVQPAGSQPGRREPQGVEPAGALPKEPSEEAVEPHDIEKPSLKGEEAVNPLGAEQRIDATASIQNAFDVFKRNLEQHYKDCWLKVQAQIHSSPKEYQQHIISLFDDIGQHRVVLLHNFEKSLSAHLKCLEETSTYVNMYSQIQGFFQSERRRLADFCEHHQLRLRSSDGARAEPASGQ